MNLNYMETLEKSGFYDKMNELIDNANLGIQPYCDEGCQQNKKERELYFEYQIAKNRMNEAPIELEKAEQRYYSYSGKYNEYEKKKNNEYKKEANELTSMLRVKFMNKIKNIKELLTSLQDLTKYKSYMEELLDKTQTELINTKKEIERKTDANNIGYRDGYYDSLEIDNTKDWNTFFRRIYWILVIVFIVIVIIYQNNYKNKNMYIILLLLILYPYFIHYISSITSWFSFIDVKFKYNNKEEQIIDK